MSLDSCVLCFLDTEVEDFNNGFIPSSHVNGNGGASENENNL